MTVVEQGQLNSCKSRLGLAGTEQAVIEEIVGRARLDPVPAGVPGALERSGY